MQLIQKKLPRAGALVLAACIFAGVSGCSRPAASGLKLLNASYSPTRELYGDYNAAFEKCWKRKTGQTVHVSMSYGGSELQARAVAEGLSADVVTLALAPDIDVIAQQGKLLPLNWQTRFPTDSSPYTSTIVFLVRKGTFVQHQLGDVLIGWESEALLGIREKPGDWLQIVCPSISILAEPPVAVVDQYALQHGERPLATAYLQYLYSSEGQEIVARNFYRPCDSEVAARFAREFCPRPEFHATSRRRVPHGQSSRPHVDY